MAEYYAVERTNAYLAHYGIKGMKWGVRKAIERGSDRGLARQYKKASRKLAKLQNNANIGYQQKRIKNANYQQKSSAALGAVSLLANAGLTGASLSTALQNGGGTFNAYVPVGAGIAAGDIIARQIGKRRARKLSSSYGHKEAVRNANDFQREMSKAFRGTRYAKNIGGLAKEIAAKKRRNVEKNVEKINQLEGNKRRRGAYGKRVSVSYR